MADADGEHNLFAPGRESSSRSCGFKTDFVPVPKEAFCLLQSFFRMYSKRIRLCKGEQSSRCFLLPHRLAHKVYARNFAPGLFGKNLPLKTGATFVIFFLHLNSKAFSRIGVAAFYGLEYFAAVAKRKDIMYRTAHQVLCAVAEMQEEGFVTK